MLFDETPINIKGELLTMESGTVRNNAQLLKQGFERCKAITRKYGTSYYFATQFFPKEIRQAIYAVYAFARIPDEIVDDPHLQNKEIKLEKLAEWRESWLQAMEDGTSKDPILASIVHTFIKHKIPAEDGEAFLRSMFMDEERSEYYNFNELEDYMYGSAGVIGLIVTRIVGYSSDEAFPYALKLGYAFQLTNFLRDIREDSEDLGRVYMPLDELRQFSLERKDIAEMKMDDRFVEFMKFQISRNKQIYREALPGIELLNWKGRLAVRISYVLYKAILTEIERANYNVYAGRVRTNFRQKLALSLKALVGVYE
jgi:15-cis-phytoene synthase